MFPKGFWALKVEPGQAYTQIVTEPLYVTMATLVAEHKTAGGRTTVFVRVNNKEYALCTLIPGQIEQQRLRLVFALDEEVSFSISGASACAIQLTGHTLMTEDDIFREELAKLSENLSHEELITVLNGMGDPDDEVDSDDIPSSEEDEETITTIKKHTLPAENDQRQVKKPKSLVDKDEKMSKRSKQATKKLPAGMVTKSIKEGSGPGAKPRKQGKVNVWYTGKFKDGKFFD